MEGRVVLHFDCFSTGGGPRFCFFWVFIGGERREKEVILLLLEMGSCWWCGEVHIVGKERGGLGWVSIWGRSEMGGVRKRDVC